MIAAILSLRSQQVEAAIRYIEEHRHEVMASYEKNMERIRRGNPSEPQAKFDAAHERLQARVRELREAKDRGGQDAGHSDGHLRRSAGTGSPCYLDIRHRARSLERSRIVPGQLPNPGAVLQRLGCGDLEDMPIVSMRRRLPNVCSKSG